MRFGKIGDSMKITVDCGEFKGEQGIYGYGTWWVEGRQSSTLH